MPELKTGFTFTAAATRRAAIVTVHNTYSVVAKARQQELMSQVCEGSLRGYVKDRTSEDDYYPGEIALGGPWAR